MCWFIYETLFWFNRLVGVTKWTNAEYPIWTTRKMFGCFSCCFNIFFWSLAEIRASWSSGINFKKQNFRNIFLNRNWNFRRCWGTIILPQSIVILLMINNGSFLSCWIVWLFLIGPKFQKKCRSKFARFLLFKKNYDDQKYTWIYFKQILISFACLDPKYLHLNAHVEVKNILMKLFY